MRIYCVLEILLPVLLVLLATVVWLSPLYPSINPLLTRANKALSRIYNWKDELDFKTKSGDHIRVQAGQVKKGDKGFIIVKKGIELNRPEIKEAQNEHGAVTEIGNAETHSDIDYGRLFKQIIPGDITYVRYKDKTFMPFIKDDLEIRKLSDWTTRMIEKYTGIVVLCLMGIWAVLVIVMSD